MKATFLKLVTSRIFRLGLGVGVSALTLYLALRNVSFQEVRGALSQADFGYVGLALVSVGANTLGKVVRWKVLLGPAGRKISLFKTLSAILIGQMLNTLYPARIGDLSRAITIGGIGPGRTFTLGTVVVEKFIDTLSYGILFVSLLFLIPLPSWVTDSGYTFVGVTLLITISVVIVTIQRDRFTRILDKIIVRFPEQAGKFITSRVHSGMSSLDVLQNRADLFKLALWTALIWGTAVLNNHLVLLALGISLPLTASLLILIALQAGISISSVPGTIGIFEYLCVLALAVFGIESTLAFSYGIVLHSIVMLPTTLLGLLFFGFEGLGGERADLMKATSKE